MSNNDALFDGAALDFVTTPMIDDAIADGLPLLTEIVTPPRPLPPFLKQALINEIHKELTHWLEEELPDAVLKITDSIADQLMRELTDQAEKQLLPNLLARLDNIKS